MATGDIAAAAGLAVFPGAQDAREGFENDNIRGDELGAHILDGTHAWDKITGKPAALSSATTAATPNTVAVRDAGGRLIVQEPAGPSHTATKNYVDAAVGAVAGTANAAAAAVAGKRDQGDGNFGGTPIFTPHGRANQVTTSYVAAYINSDGRLGASPSSRRYKENVEPLTVDLAAVLAIQPVEFDRIGGGHEVGLIAEQVDEHVPQIVVRSGEQIDGVHYHLLPVLLLAVVQDQQRELDELRHRLDRIEGKV